MQTDAVPDAATALWLADLAAERGDTLFVVRGVARLERLARSAAGFCAGRVELLVVPPWDVLPYDRIAPTPGVIGRRVQALARLSQGGQQAGELPRLLLVSAGAALQRVPGPETWADARTVLAVGDVVDRAALRTALEARGYHLGETVSDPGDLAVHEAVLDVFPAGAAGPFRLALEGNRVVGIHQLDPVSQRSLGEAGPVEIYPALEFPLDDAETEDEHLPVPSGALVPVFDYARGFARLVDEGVEARWAELWEQVGEAHAASRKAGRAGADPRGVLPPPARLYLRPEQAARFVADAGRVAAEGVAEAAPRDAAALVRRVKELAGPVVIAAPVDAVKLARSLVKRGVTARAGTGWADAVSGGVACCALEVDTGFRTDGVTVLQAAQLVRPAEAATAALAGDTALRVGDVVVHQDHGAARLAGLSPIELDGVRTERVALAYAGESDLLIDPFELDRVWRYGTEGSVDHVNGVAWRDKQAEIDAELREVAGKLAETAAARARLKAPVMEPDRDAYRRLAARFPHALSADQRGAVHAVLDDLRRGVPMNRLVCGDVGFGKTEVALRAMAAVALSGHQVALVAPTTVLARQHLETVRRRFEGTGVRVEPLFGQADIKVVRAGLADGSIGVVVGTQGLANARLRFARLGLVVIDEEQRFGEAQKQALLGRTGPDGAVHALVMTATPIPRTMQAAMVGLRDVSVIATAPVNRQPVRTVVQAFDSVVLRDALLRERARGGQSFIVCPRIADLAEVADQVRRLAPSLRVVQAHGRMGGEALEAAVVGFAGGEGDVLLATNIIEAGLDVPRANTIAVLHPDRFGLAQLHQIRGRVGRGARRGTAFFMTDPGRRLAAPTLARLAALEAAVRLGAGVQISAADLDQRGAGELFGSAQAGHVSVPGTELYQHLLLRAMRRLQGEAVPEAAPVLHVGLQGSIPVGYIGEQDLRVALYRRLARLESGEAADALAEELEDRFGPLPAETEALLALARLRVAAMALGVRQVESGPRGVAVAVHEGPEQARRLVELADRLGGTVREDRVVVAMEQAPAAQRVAAVTRMLGTGPLSRAA